MNRAGTPGGPAPVAPRIGDTLGGKYELTRLLGEGGMAFVFEAKHLRLKQRVALKVLAPDMVRDPELVARFEHEARAVANLRTPHVPRVMDVDATEGGIPFIVMEFLEGRDLDAELVARQQSGARFPLDEACDYLLQACAAMIEAHDLGIIHRDLKPANLFLASEGADKIIKVLDFGISKVVGEATKLTGAGAVMGTVLYMSPEQIRAAKDVDVRADLWSLGVILYELVAGRPPWTGSSHQIAASIVSGTAPDIRTLAPVPDSFANVVNHLLERDREKRVPNVRALVAALSPYARQGSIGGLVAEQVSSGTGARHRAVSAGKPVKSKTVPLMPSTSWTPPPPRQQQQPMQSQAPAPPTQVSAQHPSMAPRFDSSRGMSAVAYPRGPVATGSGPMMAPPTSSRAPLPTHVSNPPPAKSSKAFVVVAIFIGLVGAAGVVLFVAAYLRRQTPIAAPPRSSSSVPAVSIEPPPSSAVPPASETSGATPPPPPTGTATVEPKSSSTPASKKPGVRGTTTSTTATTTTTANAPSSTGLPNHL
jgi:serine/threonine-protein kinase